MLFYKNMNIVPVALNELNASFPFCPIPKYVITVSKGAASENINKCRLMRALQQKLKINTKTKHQNNRFTVRYLRVVNMWQVRTLRGLCVA